MINFASLRIRFSFDNCLGGSFIEENLEPDPPNKITVDIDLFLINIKLFSYNISNIK